MKIEITERIGASQKGDVIEKIAPVEGARLIMRGVGKEIGCQPLTADVLGRMSLPMLEALAKSRQIKCVDGMDKPQLIAAMATAKKPVAAKKTVKKKAKKK